MKEKRQCHRSGDPSVSPGSPVLFVRAPALCRLQAERAETGGCWRSGFARRRVINCKLSCSQAAWEGRGRSIEHATNRSEQNVSDLNQGIHLAQEFFRRVWAPPHELDAIDELMTSDYRIVTAGQVIVGRDQFKTWVAKMQSTIGDATNEHLDLFTDPTGSRVVSRWVTRGVNKGMYGSTADGRRIEYSGISIWRVQDGRLAECWVERSALELRDRLLGN